MSAHVLLNLLNELGNRDKCEACRGLLFIKSDIKLHLESHENILKRYCKVCYLVECLGYSAFI